MSQIESPTAESSLPVLNAPERKGISAASLLGLFVLIALITWLLSGFYKVGQGEVAIIERLGQFLSGQKKGSTLLVETGLHYGFPWPIDRVHKINTSATRTMEINTFNVSPEALNEFKQRKMQDNPGYSRDYWDAVYDPYLITADRNMLHVKITVNYHISDPEVYIAATAPDPGQDEEAARLAMIQKFSEYVLTREVAVVRVDDALGIRAPDDVRPNEEVLRHSLQNMLLTPTKNIFAQSDAEGDKIYDLGITVEKVDVTTIAPPGPAKQFFDNLLRAQADASVAVINAEANNHDSINRATAAADTIKLQAQAYSAGQIQKAQGDVDHFEQVYAKYQTDPQTTKFNLYTDCVNTILNANNRPYYVLKGQRLILPITAPEERIQGDTNNTGQPPAAPGGR